MISGQMRQFDLEDILAKSDTEISQPEISYLHRIVKSSKRKALSHPKYPEILRKLLRFYQEMPKPFASRLSIIHRAIHQFPSERKALIQLFLKCIGESPRLANSVVYKEVSALGIQNGIFPPPEKIKPLLLFILDQRPDFEFLLSMLTFIDPQRENASDSLKKKLPTLDLEDLAPKLSSRDRGVPGARGGHPPQPANRPDGDVLAGMPADLIKKEAPLFFRCGEWMWAFQPEDQQDNELIEWRNRWLVFHFPQELWEESNFSEELVTRWAKRFAELAGQTPDPKLRKTSNQLALRLYWKIAPLNQLDGSFLENYSKTEAVVEQLKILSHSTRDLESHKKGLLKILATLVENQQFAIVQDFILQLAKQVGAGDSLSEMVEILTQKVPDEKVWDWKPYLAKIYEDFEKVEDAFDIRKELLIRNPDDPQNRIALFQLGRKCKEKGDNRILGKIIKTMEQYKFESETIKPLKERDMSLEFEIREEISTSKWATLFRAVNKENQNSYVIKQLKELNADETRESLKKLNAIFAFLKTIPENGKPPHLCRIFQVGLFQGKPSYAMEPLNQNLYDYAIDSNVFPSFSDRLEILKGIADGLDSLHNLDILHLDLEPKNVMLRDSQNPLLIDLDSVPNRMIRELIDGNQVKKVFLNEPWGPSGVTEISKGIDIFSLGCIIFFLFSDGEELGQRFPFALDQANRKVSSSHQPRPLSRMTSWVGNEKQMNALDKLIVDTTKNWDKSTITAKTVMERLQEIQNQ